MAARLQFEPDHLGEIALALDDPDGSAREGVARAIRRGNCFSDGGLLVAR